MTINVNINQVGGAPRWPLPKNIKIYNALITQDGTTAAPTVIIRQNQIGNIVWTRTGQGAYLATLAGAFPENRTEVYFGNANGSNITTSIRSDNNTVYLDTFTNGAHTDGNLSYTPIEIRVYTDKIL